MNTAWRAALACVLAAACAAGTNAPANADEQRPAPPAAAPTPPMGWNNWAHYECNINEDIVRHNADALVSSGLAKKGYDTVTIDDCWMKKTRDGQGNLVADPNRFPRGMAWIGRYLHQRGLKFGIYEDAGRKTCGGYPGSWGHYRQDARLFASFGVDYLKFDGCSVPKIPGQRQQQVYHGAYQRMSEALRDSGRPIVFSESAPAYFQGKRGGTPPWYTVLGWVGKYGQLWRTGADVATFDPQTPNKSRWSSVMYNYSYNNPIGRFAGPGNWNDPDFLIAGDHGMTATESRSQIALWAMMSAPMILSSDVAELPRQAVEALGNRDVLAVDQDRAGVQGTVAAQSPTADTLYKPLAGGDRAVALFNRSDKPTTLRTTLADVGLRTTGSQCSFSVKNLWTGRQSSTTRHITASVAAHDTAIFRVSPPDSGSCHTSTVPTGQVLNAARKAPTCMTAAPDGDATIATCDGTAAQRFERARDGSLRTGQRCLTGNGSAVTLTECGGSAAENPQQRWHYQRNGNLVNAKTGDCLQAPETGFADQRLALRPCGHNELTQIWTLPG